MEVEDYLGEKPNAMIQFSPQHRTSNYQSSKPTEEQNENDYEMIWREVYFLETIQSNKQIKSSEIQLR